MFFLVQSGVDITAEIPLKYWIVFIIVMAILLPLLNKLLTHLFIPKKGRDEAIIWGLMDKNKKKKP